jgi:glutathione S-transferase
MITDADGLAGDQLSIVDLSLAAWLRSVVILAGGADGDDGSTAIGKLEAYLGGDFMLPKDFQVVDARRKDSAAVSKLAGFWDAMSERGSWKKVYKKQ